MSKIHPDTWQPELIYAHFFKAACCHWFDRGRKTAQVACHALGGPRYFVRSKKNRQKKFPVCSCRGSFYYLYRGINASRWVTNRHAWTKTPPWIQCLSHFPLESSIASWCTDKHTQFVMLRSVSRVITRHKWTESLVCLYVRLYVDILCHNTRTTLLIGFVVLLEWSYRCPCLCSIQQFSPRT